MASTCFKREGLDHRGVAFQSASYFMIPFLQSSGAAVRRT